jgi:hypothetical protein
MEPPAILSDPQKVGAGANDLKEFKPAEEKSAEYHGAGRIFLKAALWDIGIFSEENIKGSDWEYYLTYTKGVQVVLENNKSYFIELQLPIERCIREATDGLINNTRPFIVDKVSDQELFKASMEAQIGHKIDSVSIVDYNDHILFEINNIVEQVRNFELKKRIFVDSKENIPINRIKSLFFSQDIDIKVFIENILNLNGFDITSKYELVINLLVAKEDSNNSSLQQAAEKLNRMCIYDEQSRLINVKVS